MLQVMWIWKTFNVLLFSLIQSNKTYLRPRQSFGSHADQNFHVFPTLCSQHSFHAFIAFFFLECYGIDITQVQLFHVGFFNIVYVSKTILCHLHIFLQTNDNAQLTDILFPFTCYKIWFLVIGIINTTSKHTHLQDFV